MARPTRSRTRNLSLGPLVQHKPPSPRPGRNHTATSRKQTHNNTKGSGLNKPPQNPGLDKRCIAYGSGAVPQHTRTNAELAHRTTHRHPPPCATGPYRWQDGHATDAATCTPAHSDTSHTLKCEEPANRSRPIRIGEDSNKSGGDNADDLRVQTPRGRPCGQPLGVSHQHSASSPR